MQRRFSALLTPGQAGAQQAAPLPVRNYTPRCGTAGQLIFFRRAATASVQSWAAWKVAGGRSPRLVEICWGVMARSSAGDLPISKSVRAELQAMAATQPWVL